MFCEICKEPMWVKSQYNDKIVWACDCGCEVTIESGEGVPFWNSVEAYKEEE